MLGGLPGCVDVVFIVDARKKLAGVVAKGVPVANMVLESTALSLASSSAPVLSAEMDPNTGRPAVAVSLHLKVRMDIAVLLEVLGNFAAVQGEARDEAFSEEKILLARLLAVSTKGSKGNKILTSGDNVLSESISSSTLPKPRPEARRKWTWEAGRWRC